MKNIAIFASGSGTNAQRIAEYFADKDVAIQLIISNNANAYVLERAQKLGIKSMLIDRTLFYQTDNMVQILQDLNIDLIVLAGFLWLVPENLIKAFPEKIINIHPALLPKYGGKGMYGMHVHEAVVANKEIQSGITIHYVNGQYDKGDIILQQTCEVLPDDTAEDVAKKIHALEYTYFPLAIESLLFGS